MTYICSGVQSIAHLNAQIQLCWKNYLCGFSESEGLSNDQTTPWIQNFASKFFSGLIKANPPKNTLYHTVQMVLVDPCDKFISCLWSLTSSSSIAQLQWLRVRILGVDRVCDNREIWCDVDLIGCEQLSGCWLRAKSGWLQAWLSPSQRKLGSLKSGCSKL